METDKSKSGQYRENIKLGLEVDIVLKKDQRTGKRTRGFVRGILTSKPYHSRGIKVIIHTRQVGRVQEIIGPGKPPDQLTDLP
jgi:uncharacterized repeat protein (TIGR03833 family)